MKENFDNKKFGYRDETEQKKSWWWGPTQSLISLQDENQNDQTLPGVL